MLQLLVRGKLVTVCQQSQTSLHVNGNHLQDPHFYDRSWRSISPGAAEFTHV
jgi:hypothetical protein